MSGSEQEQEDPARRRDSTTRKAQDAAAEARDTLERLSRPTGFLDGWVMPPRPKEGGKPTAPGPLGPQAPLRKLLAGPLSVFAVLLLTLLLLLLILD